MHLLPIDRDTAPRPHVVARGGGSRLSWGLMSNPFFYRQVVQDESGIRSRLRLQSTCSSPCCWMHFVEVLEVGDQYSSSVNQVAVDLLQGLDLSYPRGRSLLKASFGGTNIAQTPGNVHLKASGLSRTLLAVLCSHVPQRPTTQPAVTYWRLAGR